MEKPRTNKKKQQMTEADEARRKLDAETGKVNCFCLQEARRLVSNQPHSKGEAFFRYDRINMQKYYNIFFISLVRCESQECSFFRWEKRVESDLVKSSSLDENLTTVVTNNTNTTVTPIVVED